MGGGEKNYTPNNSDGKYIYLIRVRVERYRTSVC